MADTLTAYATSRARFEAWAALDAPHLPSDPIDAIQVRLARWQSANFGATGDELIALGIGEECGELAQAGDRTEAIDALGDVCIYAAQLCTANRLAIGTTLDSGSSLPVDLAVPVGALQHLVLKRAQRIRKGRLPVEEHRALLFTAIRFVVRAAVAAAQPMADGITAREAFAATAEHVLARNWTANPITGAAAPRA